MTCSRIFKLAVDHKDRLDKAHFAMEEAEEAYALYNELFSMSAERDIVPQKISEAKSLVTKSWTLLGDLNIYSGYLECYWRGFFPVLERSFYFSTGFPVMSR